MASSQYYLYRAKFIKPDQMPLFFAERSAANLFLSAINDKPALSLSSGVEWHIGNIEFIDSSRGSFAVGKTTKTTLEKFDKESGDFVNNIDDAGPYTKVIFDCDIGLLGIAKKSKLAPDAATVARKIRELLAQSVTVTESGIEVRVDYIPDPNGFIIKLRDAYSIKKFKATFTGPNPTDADELFQKPLSVYAKEMGAQTGSLEVRGHALNEEVAEAVAKSTAATGNKASARIIPKNGDKEMLIRMEGEAVVISIDEDSSTSDVIERMQKRYAEVRR